MKNLLTILLFCMASVLCHAQNTNFKLEGIAKQYNNQELVIETVLSVFNDSGYVDCVIKNRPPDIPVNSVKVNSSKFLVEGEVSYPTPFNISYFDENSKTAYFSEVFLVESGDHLQITVGDLSTNRMLNLSTVSKSNRELQFLMKQGVVSNSVSTLAIQIIDFEKFKKYVQANPDSYVAMWALIITHTELGYSKEIAGIKELFSEKIKALKPFKTFSTIFANDALLHSAEKSTTLFPFHWFALGERIKQKSQENDLLLIDFWATWCKACIVQFDSLQRIKGEFKNQFDILSISVDDEKNKSKAEQLLLKKNITWENLFDFGGQSFSKFTNILPTNFLLDKNGNILKRDISAEDLTLLLTERKNRKED